MPARIPGRPDDDELAALGEMLTGLTPAELKDWSSGLDADGVEIVERALALVAGQGWRATPATMMCHFDTSKRLWRYVRLLGEAFRDAADGVDPHQIWMLPSQYGKTTQLMWGVLWLLDRDPTLRIMYLAYDADRAVDEGRKARDLAEQHAADLSFTVRRDARSAGDWKTDQGGGLYSTGIRGAITGFPQDVLLLDDLLKGWLAAHSPAEREFAWNVYRSQARMRVQSSKNPIIVVGTRWHEDDPQARLMEAAEEPNADQWRVIRLPAIAEAPTPDAPDPLLRQPDPLGREPGEVLEEERFDLAEVQARHAALGSYLTAAMEQQRPAPEEGTEILRAWWRYYDELPPAFDASLTSWDMKLKDKEAGDYVVGQAWGRTGTDFWLIDQLRGQWNQPTTKVAIVLMAVRHPEIGRHIIENTGNGPEVMEALRAPQPDYEVSDDIRSLLGMTDAEVLLVSAVFRTGLPGLLPENPKGDKHVRVRAQVGLVESGHVHLPMHRAFSETFVIEAAAFPNGAYDDQVDTWSQAMRRLRAGSGVVSKTKAAEQVGKPKPSSRARQTVGRMRARYG